MGPKVAKVAKKVVKVVKKKLPSKSITSKIRKAVSKSKETVKKVASKAKQAISKGKSKLSSVKEKLSTKKFRARKNHNTGKGASGADDVFNFTNKTNQHMNNPNRRVPVQTLKDVIEVGEAMPDPRGSRATMYYSTMYKNRKLYNIEVLYEGLTNTIYHFEYTRKAIGNLPAISK